MGGVDLTGIYRQCSFNSHTNIYISVICELKDVGEKAKKSTA